MKKKENVLVLGSNSFSGSSFVKHLLDEGHNVIGVSRSVEPHEMFLPFRWGRFSSKYKFYQLDLNKSVDEILNIVTEYEVAYIVNFAAQSMVAQSWDHPDHWFQTNTVALSVLLKGMCQLKSLAKYVHVSTPEVYGSTDGWQSESVIYNPSTPYAVSRAAGDHLVDIYCKQFGLPAVITRAANIYGPGQQLYRIVPRVIFSGLSRTRFRLDGGGVSERVFIHANDVAESTRLLMLGGQSGHSYHISGLKEIKIIDLVSLIAAEMKMDWEDLFEVGPERVGKDSAYKLNSEKIRREFDWAEKYDLEAGIKETVSWLRKNFGETSFVPKEYVHKK